MMTTVLITDTTTEKWRGSPDSLSFACSFFPLTFLYLRLCCADPFFSSNFSAFPFVPSFPLPHFFSLTFFVSLQTSLNQVCLGLIQLRVAHPICFSILFFPFSPKVHMLPHLFPHADITGKETERGEGRGNKGDQLSNCPPPIYAIQSPAQLFQIDSRRSPSPTSHYLALALALALILAPNFTHSRHTDAVAQVEMHKHEHERDTTLHDKGGAGKDN